MARRKKNPSDNAGAGSADDLRPSKTQLKAEANRRQKLGEALAALPASRRAAIPIDEALEEAITLYLGMRANEAKRRQRQYIGRLLRDVDVSAIEKAIDDFNAGRVANAESLHRAETWRDELIGSDEAITRWLAQFPQTDVQHLRSLVRQARKAGDQADPEARKSRSYRELFKLVRKTLEQTAD
ncbi:MAG: ribosome biogenesis factor YjgA [Wenzhouxiangella sp.]